VSAKLAVIILTFNEEANLPAALDSVIGWAGEIFVVDSYSTDRTVDIALETASRGVRVVQHPFENYSAQWNWALEHLPISAEWILKLDADERVTPAFREEADRFLASAPAEVHGVYFRRRIFFMGQPLNWGGVASNYDLRLWRRGKGRFDDRGVNEHMLVSGKTVQFTSQIDHHNSKSIGDWLDKHNRYASLEAINIIKGNLYGDVKPRVLGQPDQRRMWLRKIYFAAPGRCLAYFLYRFILRFGFLDGAAGFRFALLHAVFLYWIDLKIAEYRQTGKLPEVAWPARGMPHPKLDEAKIAQQVEAPHA